MVSERALLVYRRALHILYITVKEAMRKSRYFIPVLSRNSVLKKGYVQKEIKAALDVMEEIQKSDVFVIPVRIDEIEIDDKKLRGLHFVDLFPDWNHGIEAILKSACI